ncbi:MAG: NAD(P)/FAD-dependent oxidoreductase [Verrucomicrobiales bacterium]|jgi:NADH dehydrogenase|nr:NAD(P)/FAD-dependent oxidoreductase [Verrucomicrobiales bacterium]
MSRKKHIVVLGGGFGGLKFCRSIDCEDAKITLVDRQNHHLFQPLLYQVATAGLSMPEIAQPIRHIVVDNENIQVIMDEVVDIRLSEKQVLLGSRTLEYDYLVIALGAVTGYFGNDHWSKYTLGLKSLDEASQIRRQVLLAFEKAENSTSTEECRRLMTIVVIGGGPTGVEMAGALAELTQHVLKEDFRNINPEQTRVVLIEAAPKVLGNFPDPLPQRALESLQKIGVEVRVSSPVKDITEGTVVLANETILAENIIWAAGVRANPLTQKLGVELDRAGRIKVLPDCSLPGHPEVFAVGDITTLTDTKGKVVPGVSPAAMQEGRHVAKLILNEIKSGRAVSPAEREPFKYFDKGSMATIGRSAAVAAVSGFKMTGLFAWLAWLFVHLIFLIGLRNKIAVLLQWSYSYIRYKRGARIITGLNNNAPK